MRCGGLRVWTRSLTRPASCTVRRLTGDSAGAPGLFCVDADTSPCGSEDATPWSRACVRVLVRPGRVGRAGLRGAFWCASPFSLAALSCCFARPPPGWGCPFLGTLFAPPPFCFSFFSVFLFSARPLRLLLSLFSGPGCPGPWRCVLFVLLVSHFSALRALSPLLCCPPGHWLLSGCCLLPFCVSRFSLPPLGALCFFFFSLLVRAPVVSCFLWFPPPGALGLGAVLCVFFCPPLLGSPRALACLCLLLGRWLLPPPPPLLCLAVFVAAARCLLFFPPPARAPGNMS